MPLMELSKYHSYGNDFLIVATAGFPVADRSKFAAAVCDPHFGIGADGCVFLSVARKGTEFEFRVFNRDGGEAGMSGNGARCAAAYLHHRGLAEGDEALLATASGPKLYRLTERGDFRWGFRSLMGVPQFQPRDIPFLANQDSESVRDLTLRFGLTDVRIHALSVGNPQCAVMVDDLPGDEDFQRLGPFLENHPLFPDRTNVSFVRVEDRNRIRIRIWERGVGPTHSSGTGSCGAAVAAIQAGLVTSPVVVETATGSQTVEWEPGGEIALEGEAEFIADIRFLWRQPSDNGRGNPY